MKNTLKKTLSIILTLLMIVTTIPFAFAAEGDPCKNKDTWGCTGTYTAAGYCNVCSQNEVGNFCAHDLTSNGSGWSCTKCDKFFDTCPHLGYDIQTNKCITCGVCYHVFVPDVPRYTSCNTITADFHIIIEGCVKCQYVFSIKEEAHKVITPATCQTKAVCLVCGKFGNVNVNKHEDTTPHYEESTTNSYLHEVHYTCCGAVITEEHTEITYTDNGDGTHTGKYTCCGAEYETVEHDENCDICTKVHEHGFIYTYRQPDNPTMVQSRMHYVSEFCEICDESFAETTEACTVSVTCKGQVCLKCGGKYSPLINSNNHAGTEITYTDNGDGTHTGKYACCGAEYETVEHDENCDICTKVHEHSFVYTYERPDNLQMVAKKQHYVYKSCTDCDESFAETTEACTVSVTCKGEACLKCGYMNNTSTDPTNHAGTEITYTDNGDGTHTGKYACCGAEYETVAHDENCDICTKVHEHSFVYTYTRHDNPMMALKRMHYVSEVCEGCGESSERSQEACTVSVTCKGEVCLKCGYKYSSSTAPNNHAGTEITYTDNGDGTHTGVYACCGAEYETVEHDENCELCIVHEHSFVYTYKIGNLQMVMRNKHYVNKSCTDCNESFEQTTEACLFVTNCKGGTCTKCENIYEILTDPNNHASTEINYTDNGDGTHSGVHACCDAEYVTNEPHSGGTATCVSGKVCEHCKAEYGDVDADNHKDTLVQVEAKAKTCTEIGWEAYEYCTACDYTTYKEIPASHEIKTDDKKDATCTEAGHEAYEYCTECDYTTYKEIPSKGHTPLEAVKENEVAPECGVAGSYDLVVYCDVCGEELDRDTVAVDALTHTDADGDYLCDNGCGHEFEKPVDPTPDEPDTPDEPTDDNCDHLCHKDGILGFFWKIISFLQRLFGIQQYCDCGVIHYDAPIFG